VCAFSILLLAYGFHSLSIENLIFGCREVYRNRKRRYVWRWASRWAVTSRAGWWRHWWSLSRGCVEARMTSGMLGGRWGRQLATSGERWSTTTIRWETSTSTFTMTSATLRHEQVRQPVTQSGHVHTDTSAGTCPSPGYHLRDICHLYKHISQRVSIDNLQWNRIEWRRCEKSNNILLRR